MTNVPRCSRFLTLFVFVLLSTTLCIGCEKEQELPRFSQALLDPTQHFIKRLSHPVQSERIRAAKELSTLLKPRDIHALSSLHQHSLKLPLLASRDLLLGIAQMGPKAWMHVARHHTHWYKAGHSLRRYLALQPTRHVITPLKQALAPTKSNKQTAIIWPPPHWSEVGRVWYWSQSSLHFERYLALLHASSHHVKAAAIMGLAVANKSLWYTFPSDDAQRQLLPLCLQEMKQQRASAVALACIWTLGHNQRMTARPIPPKQTQQWLPIITKGLRETNPHVRAFAAETARWMWHFLAHAPSHKTHLKPLLHQLLRFDASTPSTEQTPRLQSATHILASDTTRVLSNTNDLATWHTQTQTQSKHSVPHTRGAAISLNYLLAGLRRQAPHRQPTKPSAYTLPTIRTIQGWGHFLRALPPHHKHSQPILQALLRTLQLPDEGQQLVALRQIKSLPTQTNRFSRALRKLWKESRVQRIRLLILSCFQNPSSHLPDMQAFWRTQLPLTNDPIIRKEMYRTLRFAKSLSPPLRSLLWKRYQALHKLARLPIQKKRTRLQRDQQRNELTELNKTLAHQQIYPTRVIALLRKGLQAEPVFRKQSVEWLLSWHQQANAILPSLLRVFPMLPPDNQTQIASIRYGTHIRVLDFIGHIQPPATKALPLLQKQLTHRAFLLREAAARAILRIGHSTALDFARTFHDFPVQHALHFPQSFLKMLLTDCLRFAKTCLAIASSAQTPAPKRHFLLEQFYLEQPEAGFTKTLFATVSHTKLAHGKATQALLNRYNIAFPTSRPTSRPHHPPTTAPSRD